MSLTFTRTRFPLISECFSPDFTQFPSCRSAPAHTPAPVPELLSAASRGTAGVPPAPHTQARPNSPTEKPLVVYPSSTKTGEHFCLTLDTRSIVM